MTRAPAARATVTVSSVEPLFTTITSSGAWVCAAIDFRHSSSIRASLSDGITILITAIDPDSMRHLEILRQRRAAGIARVAVVPETDELNWHGIRSKRVPRASSNSYKRGPEGV